MELKVLWAALARRWYLVLLAIVCTVVATLLVAAKVGPKYEAEGASLIFPPMPTTQRGSESVPGNPYLALDSMTQARDIVIRELTSQATGEEFDQKFPGSTYQATPDSMNNAPIIVITVDAASADSAVSGVSSLMDRVPAILTDLQSGLGIDSKSEITSKTLIADQRPDSVHKDQIRAALVTGAATLGLGLLVIGLIDGLLTGRRAKKHSAELRELRDTDEREPEATVTDAQGRSSPAGEAGTSGVARTSGGLNRLGPRSASTTVNAFPANGSRAQAADPEGRRTRSGSHRTANPAQRR